MILNRLSSTVFAVDGEDRIKEWRRTVNEAWRAFSLPERYRTDVQRCAEAERPYSGWEEMRQWLRSRPKKPASPISSADIPSQVPVESDGEEELDEIPEAPEFESERTSREWLSLEEVSTRLGEALRAEYKQCFQTSWMISDFLYNQTCTGYQPERGESSKIIYIETVFSKKLQKELEKLLNHFPELTGIPTDISVDNPGFGNKQSALGQESRLIRRIQSIHKAIIGKLENSPRPRWVKATRTLYIGEKLIRKFTEKATNSVTILDTLQSCDWPTCVDVELPLPKESSRQTPSQRLSEARKSLNDDMPPGSIVFTAGSQPGQVCWKLSDGSPPQMNGRDQ